VHHVEEGSNIDLMLHTGGGDIDAAEKLVNVLRKRVASKGRFRVIVPDFAKSAGTLMAIGADTIIMSDTSELGPIDPQIALADANGNRVAHSVNNFLDAYKEHSTALRQNSNDHVARMMLDKMDPGTIKLFESVRERSRGLAEQLLKTGMLQDKGNFTAAATKLINTEIWRTHGQVIDWSAAEEMKLDVLYLSPNDERWKRYWRLYCLQRLSLTSDGEKLYESDLVSLTAS
jgi:ClpP class serine protease